MNVRDVVDALRSEGRSLAWPGETLEALPRVTRRTSAAGDQNQVVAFALDARDADVAIREEIAHFARLGRPLEWKAYSFDEPADLVARLRAAGLTVGEREALAVYDLADGMAPFEGNSPCEVRRIESEEALEDFRAVAEAAFARDYGPTTAALAEALRTGRRGHDAYLAAVDGVPAAVGRLYTNPQSAFAGLYGGGTLPAFRRRGLYRAVVAARARDAAAGGARYLMVDALPTSEPILLRMGFATVAHSWPCEWAA